MNIKGIKTTQLTSKATETLLTDNEQKLIIIWTYDNNKLAFMTRDRALLPNQERHLYINEDELNRTYGKQGKVQLLNKLKRHFGITDNVSHNDEKLTNALLIFAINH